MTCATGEQQRKQAGVSTTAASDNGHFREANKHMHLTLLKALLKEDKTRDSEVHVRVEGEASSFVF